MAKQPPTIYHPKGSMCAVCVNKDKDCTVLDFKNMPVTSQYSPANSENIYKTVKCSEFNNLRKLPQIIGESNGH